MITNRGTQPWTGVTRAVRRAADRCGRFARDQRGSTAVQALAFLPVIILSLGLVVRLWQVLQVRRSLHHGTYLATRYLSLYPPNSLGGEDWRRVVYDFVRRELQANPFVDPLTLGTTDLGSMNASVWAIDVTMTESSYECKANFVVEVKYCLDAIPNPESMGQVLPFLDTNICLTESRIGEVLCR